jgi:hypothetical protein
VCPVSIEENQGKPQLGHQVTAFIAVDKLWNYVQIIANVS